ncbi:probable phosphate starvation-induced protein [Plesiocystis pacifica SIR-1]|uniref:PhoH-like protein n=1 Tax=Plesiocystis pacifica SIR-1 TaxID=391625 RepID=A6G508_9BACT|nr:probable phosphate starvation-induced protein [Plesiocystis pacifica SIR-1]
MFNDQRALQLVFGSPSASKRVIAELERGTGVRLHIRGTEIALEGNSDNFALVERLLHQMVALARTGRPMVPTDIGRGLEILMEDPETKLTKVFDDVVVNKANGKPIAPRSLAQKRYVDAMRRNNLVFGVGPAGTGKTFLAVAMAVRRLIDKQVRRIILSRPAIEAGENLGFLPGTLEEKVSPYMRPLYDGLYDMLDGVKVQRLMEQGVIEVAPLAYMRGRTLNDAFVILDEAQNTTREQMKMMLTRLGMGTFAVVTGDPSQKDLHGREKSGLNHALRVLSGIPSVSVCKFTGNDVMRHPLVQDIVRAYEHDERERAERREERRAAERNANRG